MENDNSSMIELEALKKAKSHYLRRYGNFDRYGIKAVTLTDALDGLYVATGRNLKPDMPRSMEINYKDKLIIIPIKYYESHGKGIY